MREPILVSCTDGVGTKLLVAIALDIHHTVGIDLVAMSVNDLLCCGATPLFLLDYVATGRLEPEKVEAIVSGIVEGCRSSGCALLGGETAELPGMYAEGHYDLAAFAVGVVERARLWAPERARPGDVVIALPSSGLHSNGYTLARKALLEHAGLALADSLPGAPETKVGAALLEPTRIYARAIAAVRALEGEPIRSAAHITGGGLVENPPRAVPASAAIELDLGAVPLPPVFAAQGVRPEEMRRTFNLGVGMLLFVAPERSGDVIGALARAGEVAYEVGRVVARTPDQPAVRIRGR
jgi:phosphoribosylformylglycinamidine cyclo-ligase